MRAFVVVELPPRVVVALEPTLSALREADLSGLLPVTSGSAHITLRFLGDVPADRLEALPEALAVDAGLFPPFQLRLGEPGAFPAKGPPGVLWVGVEGDVDAARRLYVLVDHAVKSRGHPAEDRKFAAHITVARLARNAAGLYRRRALQVLKESPPNKVAFEVDSIGLMTSHLSLAGARYERLATVPLGSRARDA